MLDNALEFMIMGGMDPALAAMIFNSGAMGTQRYNYTEGKEISTNIMQQ